MENLDVLRALANERRLQILEWLKAPRANFREQVDGDLSTTASAECSSPKSSV